MLFSRNPAFAFMLGVFFWGTFVMSAEAPQIDLRLPENASLCNEVVSRPDFLSQMGLWRGYVKELTIIRGTASLPCAKQVASELRRGGFEVVLRFEPGLSGLRIFGRVDTKLPEAPTERLEVKSRSSASVGADSNPSPKAIPGAPKVEPSPLLSEEKTAEPPTLPVPQPPPTAQAAQVSAPPPPLDAPAGVVPPKVPVLEKHPLPSDAQGSSAHVPRWQVGFLPSWIIANGSGIPANTSAFGLGWIEGAYRFSPQLESRFELLTPANLSTTFPQILWINAELGYRLVGAPSSMENVEPGANFSLELLGGILYLSQSPGQSESVSQYQDGTTLLSELATFYVGVGVTRHVGQSFALRAKAELIPVLPFFDNKMTFGARVSAGPEYSLGALTFLLTADFAAFNIAPIGAGSLFVNYTVISLGVRLAL